MIAYLRLKLIHVSKRGPWSEYHSNDNADRRFHLKYCIFMIVQRLTRPKATTETEIDHVVGLGDTRLPPTRARAGPGTLKSHIWWQDQNNWLAFEAPCHQITFWVGWSNRHRGLTSIRYPYAIDPSTVTLLTTVTVPERKFVTKIRVRYHDPRWRRQQPVRMFTPWFLLFRIVFHVLDAGYRAIGSYCFYVIPNLW